MKTYIQKGLAAICSFLIAAGLPIASMTASAEDVSLTFEAEKNKTGDFIILSVNVAGMDGVYSEHNEYTNAWNVLEYDIAYDADQVTPVQQNNGLYDVDYLPGNANNNATIEVNLNTNPVLAGAISADGQFRNGTVMTIAFELADGVAAEDVELIVNVTQFAKSVIVDGQAQNPVDLVAPGAHTVEIVVNSNVDSIAVTKQPDKTDYQWGEELDLTGAELTAFCDDGSTETVAITSDMVSGYDPYKTGQQPLTVTYGGKTTTFVVTVEGPVLPSSIAVTKQPDKTDYQWGEELDLTGAELTAFYDDGTMETVAISPDMVSGYDPYKTGQQPLTVTYGGRTTTFVVTVNEPVMPESIVITKSPDKTAYRLGEELDLTGAELTAFYDDGSTETVAITPDMVSGYDRNKIGIQALTVTYKGKTTTFAATVYRPGDVNLDGEVKSEDALVTLQAATHKIELNGAAALAANVNGDTEISSSDALQILQYATQKIDSVSSAQEVNR